MVDELAGEGAGEEELSERDVPSGGDVVEEGVLREIGRVEERG